MRNSVFAALAILPFLIACGTPGSDGDALLVVGYDPAFQAAAAAEYERLPVSCQPNDATTPPGCSVLKTMVNDYLRLRDQLRVQ